MIDIANEFVASGFKVSLVTGRLVQRNTPLHKSIKVDRIIKYTRTNILMRLITWFIAVFQIIFKVWFRYKKSYLFIVSNPPMAPLLTLIWSNSYSLLIYDVYIEKPEEFPLLSTRSFLVRLWKSAHSIVFAKADKLFTLTEGMAATIERYSKGKKCVVVPVWTDNDFLKPVPVENNPFISGNKLQDKFIVLYSGNLGVSSGIESLIDVASVTKSMNIIFLIIGNGIKRAALVKKARELKLNNCIFLPWQDTNVLPYSLASANLAVISLAKTASKRSIPSKLYNYLSVGAPILCLADSTSDLACFVRKYSLGECFDHKNIREISNFITNLSINSDRCKFLSKNAINTSKLFTHENAKEFIKAISI